MSDVMTRAQRSRCMSNIKGKNTSPETRLRKTLWAAGLRYRIHAKLPGRPDIVFAKAKVVIFVDGCFWHKCPEHGVMPKSNAEFWKTKLEGNVDRDRKKDSELQQLGWSIIRIWEHQVETELTETVNYIKSLLATKKNS